MRRDVHAKLPRTLKARAPKDWYAGGCHCGAVRFRVRINPASALECNCSICAMKGFVNLIVSKKDFKLDQGAECLATYRFNTNVAQHRFCSICGIHPFSRPRSHPDSYDINARCLDGGYDFLSITPFDGQNWEDNVAQIQD